MSISPTFHALTISRRESGVIANRVDDLCNLVDDFAVGGAPGAPLRAVDRAEIAVFVGPFVPDAHLVFAQVGDIGITLEEPEQFVNNRMQMQFLGRDQRESVGQVEAHLVAEHRQRAGPGAILFFAAVLQHV